MEMTLHDFFVHLTGNDQGILKTDKKLKVSRAWLRLPICLRLSAASLGRWPASVGDRKQEEDT